MTSRPVSPVMPLRLPAIDQSWHGGDAINPSMPAKRSGSRVVRSARIVGIP